MTNREIRNKIAFEIQTYRKLRREMAGFGLVVDLALQSINTLRSFAAQFPKERDRDIIDKWAAAEGITREEENARVMAGLPLTKKQQLALYPEDVYDAEHPLMSRGAKWVR